MSKSYMTMVGTVGTGIWISGDGGESWSRCKGMWNETQVFALTPHPQNPKVIFAGATTASTAATTAGKPSSP